MRINCLAFLVLACSLLVDAQDLEEIKILSPTPGSFDWFGSPMTMIDSFLFVSEIRDGFTDIGSVQVFVADFVNQSWTHFQTLQAEEPDELSFFGASLATNESILVVGAPETHLDSVLGGAVYIFELSEAGWVETLRLTAWDQESGMDFGESVAVMEDLIAVGALNKDNDYIENVGAVYLFRQTSSPDKEWLFEAKLTALDGAELDRFGQRVSLESRQVLVGAGDADNPFYNSGAAYIFTYDSISTNWNETAKLTPSAPVYGGSFGIGTLLDQQYALVGRPGNAFTTDVGAVYVFEYDPQDDIWSEIQVFSAEDGMPEDQFGRDFMMKGDSLLIGARKANGATDRTGAAYLFVQNGGHWDQGMKLFASDGTSSTDNFGASVHIYKNSFLAGAWPSQYAGAVYYYRDTDTGIDGEHEEIPTEYALRQNYPNPFNGETTIEFTIPSFHHGPVSLVIHDIEGQKILNINIGEQLPGTYSYRFNAEKLASGLYFYSLIATMYSSTRRMILIK